MKAKELRKKFIDFFVKTKKHKQLPSVSLVPEDDPTILFTPAGMSPLVRYLMGEPHPLGKRLCSVQKCLRTDDIEEIGDLTHFTFFEMLGNWSLGDYFKQEAISWSFEFLTDKKWLGLDPARIYISVFEGDDNAPRDEESIKTWQNVFKKAGLKAQVGDWRKANLDKGERIFTYRQKENWWGPVGQTGPCGPDTEMFYDTGRQHKKKFSPFCHPNCDCGRFFEIWNDVFMEFNKIKDGVFQPLKKKNVDTGMGLERVVALTEWLKGEIKEPDPFLTHLFIGLINQLEKRSGKKYQDHQSVFRIIADHLRASVFIINDGLEPSNKGRGYVLRKLIRRAVVKMNFLEVDPLETANKISEQLFKADELYLRKDSFAKVEAVFQKEISSFLKTIKKGAKLLQSRPVSGKLLFHLYQSYGLPLEISQELLEQWGKPIGQKEIDCFNEEMDKHQRISRKGMKQRFAGGLQDSSSEVVKLHTATHLLHQSLRQVLGRQVKQVGSNITPERLRFDFLHPRPLSKKEVEKVEALINKKIKENLKVESETMTLAQARQQGALAFFGQRYPDKVKVYTIGSFSKEVCGGPHVSFTASLGEFRIEKEESCGSGKRRIYAVLTNAT